MGTIHSSDRIAVTLYSLGTWIVSGICVNTLHKGDSVFTNNNNNNNIIIIIIIIIISQIKLCINFLFLLCLQYVREVSFNFSDVSKKSLEELDDRNAIILQFRKGKKKC
jgi:hypothetical protein